MILGNTPDAFVQSNIANIGNKRIISKVQIPLVDMLVVFDPELYKLFDVYKNGDKLQYAMLQTLLLFYKKCVHYSKIIEFKTNPRSLHGTN